MTTDAAEDVVAVAVFILLVGGVGLAIYGMLAHDWAYLAGGFGFAALGMWCLTIN